MKLECKNGDFQVGEQLLMFAGVRRFAESQEGKQWAKEHTIEEVFNKVQEAMWV